MSKPQVKHRCVADQYAGPHEKIIEVWSPGVRKGLLISIRELHGELLVEPYRGDKGVLCRVRGEDRHVSHRTDIKK